MTATRPGTSWTNAILSIGDRYAARFIPWSYRPDIDGAALVGNEQRQVIVDDYTAAYRVNEWSDKRISNADYTIVVLSQNGRSDYKLEVAVR